MLRLALAACLCASPAVAQDVRILSGYSDFRLPDGAVFDQPLAMLGDWVAEFPGLGEGRPKLELTSEIADGILTVEITESGLADDSVAMIQQRMEFAPTDAGQWRLTAYGFRQQCYRGNTGIWTDQPCL